MLEKHSIGADRLITTMQACLLLGISRPTCYRWQKDRDDFPKAIKVGPNSVRFSLREIEQFMKTGSYVADSE